MSSEWDFRVQTWGHSIEIFGCADAEGKYRILGWGGMNRALPASGDTVLLKMQSGKHARFLLIDIERMPGVSDGFRGYMKVLEYVPPVMVKV